MAHGWGWLWMKKWEWNSVPAFSWGAEENYFVAGPLFRTHTHTRARGFRLGRREVCLVCVWKNLSHIVCPSLCWLRRRWMSHYCVIFWLLCDNAAFFVLLPCRWVCNIFQKVLAEIALSFLCIHDYFDKFLWKLILMQLLWKLTVWGTRY